MSKTITTVYVDSIALKNCQRLGYKISPIVNNVLNGLLSRNDDKLTDLIEIDNKLDKIKTKLVDLKLEQEQLLIRKTTIEDKEQKDKDIDLKEKIKMAEAIKRSGLY